jgi:hypothetical protein
MNDLFNAPSSTPPAPPSGPLEPRKVAAGRGWQWIVEAWRIVRAQWLMWITLVLAYFLIEILTGMVALVGQRIGVVIGPLLLGGLMLGCNKATHGAEVELADLFAGFRQAARPLLGLGLMMMLLFGGTDLTLKAAGLEHAQQVLEQASSSKGPLVMPSSKDWLLLGADVLVSMTIAMGSWLAPALIVLSGAGPLRALGLSFKAGLRNWLAMLVCGLSMTMLGVLAIAPFGLGLLLWLPVMTLTGFTAWRDVFGPREAVPEQEYLIG